MAKRRKPPITKVRAAIAERRHHEGDDNIIAVT